MFKKVLIGILILLLGAFGYVAYMGYQVVELAKELGPCGFAIGPYEGESLNLAERTCSFTRFFHKIKV